MALAERFASFVHDDLRLELLARPETGVVVWRPRHKTVLDVSASLPVGLASQTVISGETWLRCVAANPVAQMDEVIDAVSRAV